MDYTKCVMCDACVRACEKQTFAVYNHSDREKGIPPTIASPDNTLARSKCIGCGQCTLVCPTGCLTENKAINSVRKLLETKPEGKVLVVSMAPAVRTGVAEALGVPVTPELTRKIFGTLKRLGFDYVFDVSFAADVTIVEEASELVGRLLGSPGSGPLPMFTSCCPGWITAVEKEYPELIPHLSTTRSPQGILGSCVKNVWSREMRIRREDIINITVMPCTAKKAEARRSQLNGETDYVLTTRELLELVALMLGDKSELLKSNSTNPDDFLDKSSGAGVIFGTSGGVMEAALRTAHKLITGKESEALLECSAIRGTEAAHSMKEAIFKIGDKDLNILVVHGGEGLRAVAEGVLKKDPKYTKYHFIEIMACPGGCVGGGGQPLAKGPREKTLATRSGGLYNLDTKNTLRRSHENNALLNMYRKYIGKFNGPKAHELFHTHYSKQ